MDKEDGDPVLRGTDEHGSSGGGIATGNNNVTLLASVVTDNSPDNCSPINTIPGGVN